MIESEGSASCSLSTMQRTAGTQMTPHERAGQTRRQRTRRQIEAAVAELLSEADYDDIRAAHIIERAGVGAATFYQVVGDKSRATASLVLGELDPDTWEQPGMANPSEHREEELHALLSSLGQYGFKKPRFALGFCRAYYKNVAALPRGPEPIHPCHELIDEVRRRLAGAVRNLGGSYLAAELNTAPFITIESLLAAQTPHPEDWRLRIDRLMELLQLPSGRD